MSCYRDDLSSLALQDALQVSIEACDEHICKLLRGKMADFTLMWNSKATFRVEEMLTGRDENIFFFCSQEEFSRDQCHTYIQQKPKSLTLVITADHYSQTIRVENDEMILTIILVICIALLSVTVLGIVFFVQWRKNRKEKTTDCGDTEIDPLVLEKPGKFVDSGLTSKLG